jgi:UrcA family protein
MKWCGAQCPKKVFESGCSRRLAKTGRTQAMQKYLAAIALFALPLSAAQAAPVATTRVKVTSADLASPEGIAALRGRISAAVRDVCARSAPPESRWSQSDCLILSQADAERQLKSRLRSSTWTLAAS